METPFWCNFCRSSTKEKYIYAECGHFLCLQCTADQWDRKYGFRCCNKITFLEESTCLALQKSNQQPLRREDCKQNHQPPPDKIQKHPSLKEQRPREVCSVYIPLDEMASKQETDRQNLSLIELQKVMADSLNKVKLNFEAQRRQLERKQQTLLRDLYNRYSQHLAGIKSKVTEEDVKYFKEKANRLIDGQEKQIYKEIESKQDKILEKLQYNQLKMKEKLNRHYELLK